LQLADRRRRNYERKSLSRWRRGLAGADLITVRGLTLLRKADVVLYDHLIARELLDEIAPPAERIFVGKDPERHTVTQEVINELLVDRVRRGPDGRCG